MTTEPPQKTWIQIQNEPVKALKKLNLIYAASRRIRDRNGLTMFSVTGTQQSGKSSYAMRILEEIYCNDVDEIMRHIVFSMEDFTKIISDAINGGYREKCVVWDDASVSGSAARWTTDPKMVMYLAGLGDTLGIATKSLILTSPSGDMIKAFRNYAKYKVIISNGQHKYERVARGYWIGKSPMEQRYCQHEFTDTYDTRIPFYERYAQRRKELSLSAVKNLESFIHGESPEESHMTLNEQFGVAGLIKLYEKEGSWSKVAETVSAIKGKSISAEACRKVAATTTPHPGYLVKPKF